MLFFLLISCGLFAGSPYNPNPLYEYPITAHSLIGTGVFDGDRHGDFRNDYVAVLEDGSAWKIHPTQKRIFEKWGLNDVIQVEKRTDWYWFKREHKFLLRNHTRNETAKVMLIQYPSSPLQIVNTDTYIAYSRWLYVQVGTDFQGNSIKQWQLVHTWEKKLYLNDGTTWLIRSHFDKLTPNTYVYFGVNKNGSGYDYFMIGGTEREAVYAWTTFAAQEQ